MLQDTYYKLLGIKASFKAGAAGPAAPTVSVVSESVGTATLSIVCQNGGANTDPASGEVLYLQITASNSTAI